MGARLSVLADSMLHTLQPFALQFGNGFGVQTRQTGIRRLKLAEVHFLGHGVWGSAFGRESELFCPLKTPPPAFRPICRQFLGPSCR